MDEIQTANVKSTEAVSSTKAEITAARKELQALGLELQGLVTQVSLQYMYIRIKKECQPPRQATLYKKTKNHFHFIKELQDQNCIKVIMDLTSV